MCFIDSASLSSLAEGVSRRRFLGAGLVAGLTAAAIDWGTSLVLPGVAEGAETPGASGGPRAAGVAEGKIVQVKGGEYMQFDGYTIEVFPGIHSMGPTKKHAVPGHLYHVPSAPTKIGDLPEGDSLIYTITIGGKFSIFLMSTANYNERAIAGLKPDVALIASIFSNQIHDFTPRLLTALNYPKIVLPTHWDNFEAPFSAPPRDLRDTFGDPANLDLWVKEVKQLSPKSQIVTMKYFESFAP